jgi:hypothetical protein
MLASGSDDGTVRIWGTEEQMKAELQYQKEREHLREQLLQVREFEARPRVPQPCLIDAAG